MSSFKHPVGSESSSVYWRRRAVVIGVVLLVVVIVVLIVARPGSGSDATPVPSPGTSDPATSGSPATAAPAASAPSTPAPSTGATAKATDAPAASAGSDTCASDGITLKAVADKASYSSLEQPQISMSITNTATTACSVDLGSAEQVLTITSGEETYWSSKDCQVNGTHQNVTIKAGQTLTTPAIAWDRTRSSTKTCDSSRSSVPAGGATYHLSVAVGSIKSATSALMVLN